MNEHQPAQPEPNQPTTRSETARPISKPWYNQGWIWLIVAMIGIGVVYFGISGMTEEMANIHHSIDNNTEALKAQTGVLSKINHGIHQLIFTIKETADKIIQKI